MADNLQKLIKLAKADNGKFFVIDEQGNPVLVIMGIEEYEAVLLKKVANQLEDIEDINRKIIEAQKEEDKVQKKQALQEELVSEVIDSTFSFEPDQVIVNDATNFGAYKAELEDI
ncbi:MAG: hypothetical protein JWO40_394 [Candidatus Doudnabacteria bacterium]|nr:hypothetical protein [Candidatus Doudnabacteria bacterium]